MINTLRGRPIGSHTGRFQPRLEWLEPRLTLSASPLAADTQAPSNPPPLSPDLILLGANPASGAVTDHVVSAVTLTFDRPIDPNTLGGDTDFDLLQVADDDSTTSIYYPGGAPVPTAVLDASGTQLTLTLNQTLGPGRYQLLLTASAGLAGLDGSVLTSYSVGQLVSDFQITARGTTLGDAVDLGTPAATPSTTAGSLDLAADPSALALYKLTLPRGHFWRLGLEVPAHRDGDKLGTALALFDSRGQLIAADTNGRSDFPNDPYLFAGLQPGTYYVGVSASDNVPGTPGGYDPAAGTPGTGTTAQIGGGFTLHFVAGPEDVPSSLLTFRVDQADPLDSTPTGLTLGFSAAIRVNPTPGTVASQLDQAIMVTDQDGRVWPVVAVKYVEKNALVSYLFQDRLPAGHYLVEVPPVGGLSDLAGLSPIVPGQAAGILGAFDVGPAATAPAPNDLGPLLPAVAEKGLTIVADLDPGASVTDRVVITFPGQYTFQSRYSGGTLSITGTGPAGAFTIDPGLPDHVNGTNNTFLVPGVYQIQLTATGSDAVHAHLTLSVPSASQESLLENGVGQGPALDLLLIAPTAMTPDPTPVPLPVPVPVPIPVPDMAPPPVIPTPGGSSQGSTSPGPPSISPSNSVAGPSSSPAPAASTPGLASGTFGASPLLPLAPWLSQASTGVSPGGGPSSSSSTGSGPSPLSGLLAADFLGRPAVSGDPRPGAAGRSVLGAEGLVSGAVAMAIPQRVDGDFVLQHGEPEPALALAPAKPADPPLRASNAVPTSPDPGQGVLADGDEMPPVPVPETSASAPALAVVGDLLHASQEPAPGGKGPFDSPAGIGVVAILVSQSPRFLARVVGQPTFRRTRTGFRSGGGLRGNPE